MQTSIIWLGEYQTILFLILTKGEYIKSMDGFLPRNGFYGEYRSFELPFLDELYKSIRYISNLS